MRVTLILKKSISMGKIWVGWCDVVVYTSIVFANDLMQSSLSNKLFHQLSTELSNSFHILVNYKFRMWVYKDCGAYDS